MTGRKLAKTGFSVSIVAFLFVASSNAIGPAWATQCVPYARNVSGINLHGAAWTWWESASGRYQRGTEPKVGAALVFKRLKGMPSGHVAVVTKLVNERLIEVSHANWVHRGQAGKVEIDAAVYDESPNNDWSQLRVWYSPIHGFGAKVYPAYGFVYPLEVASRAIDRHDSES
jgi:surface antigen